MFDTELFILKIEKRPSLWDVRSPQFKDRLKKYNDWNGIAAEMTPNWSSLNAHEQQLRGQDIMKKWKNLKDKFRKILKEEKSGIDTYKSKTPYRYFHVLQFLRPVLLLSLDKNSVEDEHSTEEQEDEQIEIEAEPSRIIDTERRRFKRRFEESNPELNTHRISQTMGTNITEREMQDEDILFLLSLAPKLRKMTPRAKLRTKIEMLTAVEKNTYGIAIDSGEGSVDASSYIIPTEILSSGNPLSDIERVFCAEARTMFKKEF